jgi:hypothetical protein
MTESLTVELDDDARLALTVLTRDGSSVSAAVRHALIRAAAGPVQEQRRDEAPGLAADEADQADAMQVLRDIATLRAW